MKSKEVNEVVRESIRRLLELGYSYKEIYDALSYMVERDRLLSLAAVNGGWHYICKHETLPAQFIEEFSNEVDWNLVSIYQNLNSDLIDKFADKVDWFYIFLKQDLSDELLCKYKERIRKAIHTKLYNAGK